MKHNRVHFILNRNNVTFFYHSLSYHLCFFLQIAKLTAIIQDLKLSSQNAKSALAAEAAQRSKELASTREELEERLSETQTELREREKTIHNLRLQVQDANQSVRDVVLY